jgi:adenosine deaminase CECR1
MNKNILRTRLLAAGMALSVVLLIATSGCVTDSPGLAPCKPVVPRHSKNSYLLDIGRYHGDRSNLIHQHYAHPYAPAPQLPLTPAETNVNNWLHASVLALYGTDRASVAHFAPARPFYDVKEQISTTDVFRLIQKMPKGGLLHSHLTAAGRIDWLMEHALALTNCHVKWADSNPDERGSLKFHAASGFSPATDMLSDTNFAKSLRQEFTLGSEDNNGEFIWRPFSRVFKKLNGLRENPAVFNAYLVDAFDTLWKDHIYVAEFRDSVGPGDSHDLTSHINLLTNIVAARNTIRTKYNTTNFHVRIIVHGIRNDSPEKILKQLRQVVTLRTHFPDLIAGFDLVGGEDDMPTQTTQKRIVDVLPVLQRLLTNAIPADLFDTKILQQVRPTNAVQVADIPFYLHDGESLWADNDNLFDAVLLESPRIGHGFNLFRYPTLYPAVKTKGIALEVCPISNQLLGLTPDLRLHPAGGYIKAGIPCVLSSDDPLIFGNDGLSYDFWAAIVAWNLDLATIKQLARNSIVHSSLDEPLRQSLLSYWEAEWNQFIVEAQDSLGGKQTPLWTDASSSTTQRR